jgi:hypothetical protein
MPRAMSLRMRDRVKSRVSDDPQHLGAKLGAAMLKYNVPAPALAEHLQVSPDTIYRWSYEDDVPHARRADVRDLLFNLRQLLRSTSLSGSVEDRTHAIQSLLVNTRR